MLIEVAAENVAYLKPSYQYHPTYLAGRLDTYTD